ncbi:MAG: potassium channel protein [Planctomycetota bacterium]
MPDGLAPKLRPRNQPAPGIDPSPESTRPAAMLPLSPAHAAELAAHRRQRRNVKHAVLAMLVVIAVGTAGFTFLEENWTAWDALFFTLITITTVGYGDYGLDMKGEMFALFLLLTGIAVTTYAFGQVVQLAVSQRSAWRRRMLSTIAQLQDHYIVCGVGRVGRAVCERFEESGIPLVVVDKDPERCQWARDHGHLTLEADATDDDTLIAAGIKRSKGLVAAAPYDNDNLVITLTARGLNPDTLIVCRAGDPEAVTKFKRAGADRVVAPETSGGHTLANLLVRPHMTDFLAHTGEDDYQLSELHIRPDSELAGTTIEALGSAEPQLVFVALKRDDQPTKLRPDMSHILEPGDVLIVIGQLESLARIAHHAAA